MPLVTIQMIEGRDVDTKRKLIANVTNAILASVDTKIENVRIVIEDMKPENYALGGTLHIDKVNK
ncbi:MAG: 2-hydroxymuconate tautomerase [Alphaproteobacteria bacterium]|jgi:4-oxalocrotonate tautomerase|nr:tautomerase family protein [Candidatus Jidaibacter sp.]